MSRRRRRTALGLLVAVGTATVLVGIVDTIEHWWEAAVFAIFAVVGLAGAWDAWRTMRAA